MLSFFKKSTIVISRLILDQIIDHAKEAYPHECCGAIVGIRHNGKKVFAVHRLTNTNTDRASDRYQVDPKEVNLIDKMARVEGLDIIGFYHSHPDHPDKPSQFDREMGQPDYSYIIVSVNKGTEVSAKSWIFSGDNEPFKEETIKIS